MPTGPDLRLYEVSIDQVLARQLAGDVPGLVALRAKVEDVALPLVCNRRFRNQVLGTHLANIERRIGLLYGQLIDKRTLVTGVRIDPQSFRISLLEGKGAKIQEKPLNKLSSGERQLLATAILWGLAKESGRPLPVGLRDLGRAPDPADISLATLLV